MNCMDIWMLNHHANLNGMRHYELACEFAKCGNKVLVIASSYEHGNHRYTFNEPCHIEEVQAGVVFVYLHTKPAYTSNGIGRVMNMINYYQMVRKYTERLSQQYGAPDFVIGSSVHPLAWEAGYWVAKKFKARFICEVRDFWPLSLIEIGGISKYHPIVIFFGLIERRAYRHADKIVTTFPYGYKYICDEMGYPRNKVEWIPNGIRITEKESGVELPEELQDYLASHWCCIYAGSFVESEGINFMLDAFYELRNEDIYFAIIGSGSEHENIEKKIQQLSLNKVRIFPRIKKTQVQAAHRIAACCLAAHQNHTIYRYGLSMNKLNDYLLSGKPVIFACDAPNVVKEAGHITMPYGDAKEFANAIRRVREMGQLEKTAMGERGKAIIINTYDYRIIAQKYMDLLERIG